MYAIIFWEDDSTIKPWLNANGTLFLNFDLAKADKDAEGFQKETGLETRVISLEAAK